MCAYYKAVGILRALEKNANLSEISWELSQARWKIFFPIPFKPRV